MLDLIIIKNPVLSVVIDYTSDPNISFGFHMLYFEKNSTSQYGIPIGIGTTNNTTIMAEIIIPKTIHVFVMP